MSIKNVRFTCFININNNIIPKQVTELYTTRNVKHNRPENLLNHRERIEQTGNWNYGRKENTVYFKCVYFTLESLRFSGDRHIADEQLNCNLQYVIIH